MPRQISSWFRKKLTTTKPSSSATSPPTLPTPRPRPLTPPPHQPSTTAAAATAHSPLFHRLPPELRRQILTFAFGARTLHIDLEFAPPPLATSTSSDLTHCNLPTDTAGTLQRDPAARPAWRWSGSTCHRNPPWVPVARDALWRDSCRTGWMCACEAWAGAHPVRCWVGAMGWLRACRQAYAEGVVVLYETNTLHVASVPLMLGFERLLLPQRLAGVRALEMVWELRGGAGETPREVFGRLVRVVSEVFPRLEKLHVSLQGRMFHLGARPAPGRVDEAERDVVEPLDGMVLRFERPLRQCIVEFPYTLFVPLQDRAQDAPSAEGMGFWRSLPAGERGYWIKCGDEDLGMLDVYTSRTGW